MTFEPGDKIGGLNEAELLAFLAHPWNARIATITAEGWPYVTPVWYELDLDARSFLIVGREHALWVAHIRDNPRVASHVADDEHAEHTRVLVQATAEILEGPVAPRTNPRLLDLTYRLSLRYLGPDRRLVRRAHARPPACPGQSDANDLDELDRPRWHPRYR